MKYLLLLAIVLNLNAEELQNELELNVFGLSYHTNRNYNFNEVNPGLGLGLVFNKVGYEDDGSHMSMVVSAGEYKDSFNNTAYYILAGPRLTLGYEDSFHATAEAGVGLLHGSGNKSAALVPVVSVGYDRFNLCVTGELGNTSNEHEASKMIALFLRVKLFDF